MALCVISYDLHKVRNYQPLYDLLQKWKAARLLESLWLANLLGPAATVRDIVKSTVDNDDSIAIIELDPASDWAVRLAKPAGVAWLQKYMP